MKYTTKCIGLLAAVIASTALSVAGPASAGVNSTDVSSEQSSLSGEVQAQIDAIPVVSLRDEISASLAEHSDAGSIQGVSIDYAPYVPESGDAGPSARALPSGCGQASIVFQNGNQIWNQVFSSCDGKSWSELDYHLRLVRINPYNPYDTQIVKDSYPDMGPGSSDHYDQTIDCRNENETNWDGYAKGTMVLDGVSYAAESGDIEYQVSCGW